MRALDHYQGQGSSRRGRPQEYRGRLTIQDVKSEDQRDLAALVGAAQANFTYEEQRRR
ncbi:hypothetical protein C8Q80DRAFT_762038 [Daedaleopsis nitida]|nr:hypothetical protein C8Q80DRAFT_762038 [Daedaleopsis nitida]